jgi:VanZ family protein
LNTRAGESTATPGLATRWAPVVAWALVISVLSSDAFSGDSTGSFLLPLLQLVLPGASPDVLALVHAVLRKLAHVVEYAILAVLVCRALTVPGRAPAAVAIGAILFSAGYATLDELRQTMTPSRIGSPIDVTLDTLGASLGVAVRAAAAALLSADRRSRA